MIERKRIIVVKDDAIEDIKCDICGKSCCVYEHPIEPERELKIISTVDDSKIETKFKDYEYMKLSASWGYYSKNKDLEYWEAYVCEDCVDEHLAKLIKFRKGEVDFGTHPTLVNPKF